ncbi:MAG: MarR family transcriptional regulator [Oscillospiraceae bacterium]
MNQTLAYYATLLHKDFTEYCNHKLAEEGLSQGKLYFILYVGRHTGCSPKELAKALHMDGGHTTRTLAKLAQDGFLAQEKSKTDGRAHTLRLTEKGDAAFRRSHELFTAWDAEALGPLTAEEKAALMTLLSKLVLTRGGMPCDREGTVHPN